MSKKVAIIGSGQLAKHIAHYISESGQMQVAGFICDFAEIGKPIDKHIVLGKIEDAEKLYKSGSFDSILIGVGYSRILYKKTVFDRFNGVIPFATFIHKSCFIDSTAVIDEGCILFPGCIIDKNVHLKSNVFIHCGSCIAHDTTIEAHTIISATVSVAGFVEIGSCCNIGIGTTIIDNITLCDEISTGGGAVVIDSITDKGLYVGVPAKKIR